MMKKTQTEGFMRTVMLFIDGLGLAPAGDDNPLSTVHTPHINKLLSGHHLTTEALGYHNTKATLLSLDANLGLPGLPQSATGQTTLFTGINAAKAVGCHISGFPTEPLRNIIAAEGMLKRITAKGYRATFLNSYRPQFFTLTPEDVEYFSASTLLNMYAGLPFRTFDQMANGHAVYSDITNQVLIEAGFAVASVTPEKAAKILTRISHEYDFLLFEHFQTDVVGHKSDTAKIAETVQNLDRFLGAITLNLDFDNTLLILTSDHGNLEDNSVSTHTNNPVPLLMVGAGRDKLPKLQDLTDVVPLILAGLDNKGV
jgi:2,3-bisphosphoglycerate-independent phosphoglycerate mutase